MRINFMPILTNQQLHILQLHKLPFSTALFDFTTVTAQIVISYTLKYALEFGNPIRCCRAFKIIY